MSDIQKMKLKKGLFLIALSFICVLFSVKYQTPATHWSLLPPALAIFIAFVTGKLSLSLGSAIFLGSFIYQYGASQNLLSSTVGMVTQSGNYFFQAATDKTNIQILGFVFFILSMVHVMTISGGLHGLVRYLQKWIVGSKSAQFVTALLGCFIFIDDYANTMIVGSTMRSVTDKYRISREKLAFLVDATSAPIAGVALVSTWIGYEVGLFGEMAEKFSWGVDGYAVFLGALQFRFYCFLMLIFVFVNVLFGFDFGPMRDYQPSPIAKEENDEPEQRSFISCSLIPLSLLLMLVFSLLWRDGGGLDSARSFLSFSDWRHVLTNSENSIWILFVASLTSYFVAVFLALVVSKVNFKELQQSFLNGLKSSALPIVILVLAWSLKEVCDDLKTGEYVVSLLSDRVEKMWLPIAIFLVSAVTAFSTGTSWGTMAILIPTVTPLAVELGGGEYGIFVSLCLAAILDGAIMGDHCSPISDTTIMSSISTGCDLLSHVKTQLPYSLIVGLIAILCGYLPAAQSGPLSFSLFSGLFLIVFLFFALKAFRSQRKRAL